MKNALRSFYLVLLIAVACNSLFAQVNTPAAPAATGAAKRLGSIRKISGSDLSLVTDQGSEFSVKVQAGARILRLAPGQTDLKGAAAIQLGELQVGDRLLVRGTLADDGVSINATAVIVMKRQDIAQMNQQELLDWQRRSIGGVVKQVESQTGDITLTVNNKIVVVSTTPKTSYKRYAPDSVRWEDAAIATLSDIHPGDQLRAKGNKNEDGTRLTADEIVAGKFRNVAGLITAIDAEKSTLTVQDLATKKPITVRVSSDSQMKKLPPQIAQGIAMRMKGENPPAGNGAAQAGGPPEGARSRGDLNQLLARLPSATINDLQKGEAVMIVSTEGSPAQSPIAITLLDGVEPILTASPAGANAQSILTPWSLASVPGGDQ